jgi:Na+/phosphate symporter
MPNDLHYFMFFAGRLFQGAEMMIRHSEYIEADESNLMYDFVAAREATREALKEVREFLAKMTSHEASDERKTILGA